jgi:regulator of cell morphogenesis and NO signaling
VALFPPLLERGAAAAPDVAGFRDDHEEVGRRLAELRELTDDFQAPEGACNTWRALWAGLEALEASLHEHVHLENNVLFPRLAAAA